MGADPVRIDRWLWSVRLFKTRSAATNACSSGQVRIGDDSVKPARKVRIGEVIEVKRRDLVHTYEVTDLISKRVGAPIAEKCYVDLTPERPKVDPVFQDPGDVRPRGAGRPTKRDRRALEKLRGRSKR